ncbi:Crp/Fnr family transcriptional regulator [Dokdonia sp.]|uniref:Crp/Fnr family transcriptional regulator n=1 Tax=Dokdonia sp. TaxID=2024995 RepID=UPI0032664542
MDDTLLDNLNKTIGHKFREKIEEYVLISNEEWNIIENHCEVFQIKNKEVLVKYGTLNKNVFFLAQGSFEMSLILEHDDTKTVWFFEDEIFNMLTTVDSVLLNEHTKYEITALEDSLVVKFDFDKFDFLASKYQNINEFIKRDIMDGFVVFHEIRNHMISHSPADFITYFHKKFPTILHKIPDKNIAQFMGITPEWYSKIKKKVKT